MPPSITCHQPICLNASLYNMSSTNQSVSVPPYTMCRLPKWILHIEHVINKNVCMPNSTTSHQPQCLHTYHDNMSSTNVCVPPSISCLLSNMSTTNVLRASKMCHQIKCLHGSIYNMASTKVYLYLPLQVPSTNVSACISLYNTILTKVSACSLYTMLSAKVSAYLRV